MATNAIWRLKNSLSNRDQTFPKHKGGLHAFQSDFHEWGLGKDPWKLRLTEEMSRRNFIRTSLKIQFLWNVTPCLPVNIYRRFEESLLHHLQDQAVRVKFSSLSPLSSWLAWPWRCRVLWPLETSVIIYQSTRRITSGSQSSNPNLLIFLKANSSFPTETRYERTNIWLFCQNFSKFF